MILIGLTGGIASGKSTVDALLETQHHIEIIDCDRIVRELQSKGSSAVRAIARTWPQCVTREGELDRVKLGEVVFGDPSARRKLAAIMNHRILLAVMRRVFAAWWRVGSLDVVVLDAPLLFETNLFTKIVTASVLVSCDAATQKHRLLLRNTELTAEEADKRIAAQMPLEWKRKRAQYCIDNSGDRQALELGVAAAVEFMRRQSKWRFPSIAISAIIAAIVTAAAWRLG